MIITRTKRVIYLVKLAEEQNAENIQELKHEELKDFFQVTQVLLYKFKDF
jgi:hypothetical protein